MRLTSFYVLSYKQCPASASFAQAGDNTMTTHEILAQVILYITILLIGISVGGNVYEILVLDPLWSSSPPESVRKFFEGTGFAKAMQKFWLSKLAKYSLFFLIAAVVLAWHVPARRPWLILALCTTAATYFLTIRYIFRKKVALFARAGSGMSPEAVVHMTRQFLALDRVRLVFKIATFFFLLRALTL